MMRCCMIECTCQDPNINSPLSHLEITHGGACLRLHPPPNRQQGYACHLSCLLLGSTNSQRPPHVPLVFKQTERNVQNISTHTCACTQQTPRILCVVSA